MWCWSVRSWRATVEARDKRSTAGSGTEGLGVTSNPVRSGDCTADELSGSSHRGTSFAVGIHMLLIYSLTGINHLSGCQSSIVSASYCRIAKLSSRRRLERVSLKGSDWRSRASIDLRGRNTI